MTVGVLQHLLANFSPRPTHERYWAHLVRILNTPRPSTDFDGTSRPERLDHIKRYIREFTEEHNFMYSEDKAGNVFVRSNSPLKPLVTFQGHLDIVTSKNADVLHDWETEGTDPRFSQEADGAWIRPTKATTLGADNGVAIAAALAVMETQKTLPLEAVFTVDEETSFYGASNIEAELIHADYLLNLDSEEDGKVCIGSAGGFERYLTIFQAQEPVASDDERPVAKVVLRGLPGGHSGVDIDRGRPHAMKVIAGLLKNLDFAAHEFSLVSVTGGSAKNVIPREVTVLAKVKDLETLRVAVGSVAAEIGLPENAILEVLPAEDEEKPSAVFVDAAGVFDLILDAHHGRQHHLEDASVNFATVATEGESLVFSFFARSSFEQSLTTFAEELSQKFPSATASDVQNAFAAWQPEPHSKFTRVVAEASPKKDPELYAVHAGLECGVILQRANGRLSAASIGPDILGAHSPDERLSVESSIRFIDWVDAIVAKLQEADEAAPVV